MTSINRQERTRQLIQIGAIFEKHLSITTVEEATALVEIATADPKKLENLKRLIKAKVDSKR